MIVVCGRFFTRLIIHYPKLLWDRASRLRGPAWSRVPATLNIILARMTRHLQGRAQMSSYGASADFFAIRHRPKRTMGRTGQVAGSRLNLFPNECQCDRLAFTREKSP